MAYYANQKFFKSRLVTMYSKRKLYRTVIRSIVTYASETWVLKEISIQRMLVCERKIFGKISGPAKENQLWRIKTNNELDKLIKHQNIVNHIRVQRLNWFGHVQRMPDSRTVIKIFNWQPLTKRSNARPKYRRKDNINRIFAKLEITKWTVCVQDRGKWKHIVEKA